MFSVSTHLERRWWFGGKGYGKQPELCSYKARNRTLSHWLQLVSLSPCLSFSFLRGFLFSSWCFWCQKGIVTTNAGKREVEERRRGRKDTNPSATRKGFAPANILNPLLSTMHCSSHVLCKLPTLSPQFEPSLLPVSISSASVLGTPTRRGVSSPGWFISQLPERLLFVSVLKALNENCKGQL